MSATPRTVAILGSCTTRDNFNARFNPEHRRWYEVGASANQTSVIALMSPPLTAEPDPADGLSEYDTWNVRNDLGRELLTELAAAPPDLLVVDFFGDVHFGVLRLPDGRYLTDNSWKVTRTAQYRALVAAGGTTSLTLTGDPEEYVRLWAEALDRLATFLAEHCPRTRVVVHRGFYAHQVVTGPTGRPQPLRRFAGLAPLDVPRGNALWARLDDHAITAHGWDAIDLRAERYTSTAEHPWGPFYVHYSLDYYHRFLAELHALDLGARLPADLAERVAVVAAAARERNSEQAAFVHASVREQDTGIRELEARGVRATLRSVLGRGPR